MQRCCFYYSTAKLRNIRQRVGLMHPFNMTSSPWRQVDYLSRRL